MKKITEIKVTLGKDTVVFTPTECLAVVAGKTVPIPDKLARDLWKTITGPAEKTINLLLEVDKNA